MTPIPVVLHCPKCGLQHIDKPEGEHSPICNISCGMPAQGCSCRKWDNPPHRSHLCHGCGHIWRPADVPTTGVAAVQTKGKADSPIPKQTAYERGFEAHRTQADNWRRQQEDE